MLSCYDFINYFSKGNTLPSIPKIREGLDSSAKKATALPPPDPSAFQFNLLLRAKKRLAQVR